MKRTRTPDWREQREQRGLTLSEVARRAGLNKGDLSRIETKRLVPTADEARAILRALGDDRAPVKVETTA